MRHRLVLARTSLEAGLWIGMLGGGVELVVAAWRRWVQDRLLFVGSDYWWLTPLLAGAIVAVATLFATALVPRHFATAAQRIRFAIPLILASLSVLLMFRWLAPAAAVVLAIGVGLSTGRWLALRARQVDRVVRLSLPVMVLASLLGGVGLNLDKSRWADRGDARNVDGPNVLLLVLDTVRAIELGLYGFAPSTSPAIDGLGASGVVFDHAFSTAPWSGPSHGSLFTGRKPAELSIDWDRPLDATFPTLAEELGRAGYSTVGIVGNTAYASAETGLGRGFDRYEDYELTLRRALSMPSLTRRLLDRKRAWMHEPPLDGAGRIPAASVNRRLLSWLEQRPRHQPYFAFLNFYDAHAPYSAPEPFWSRFLPGETRRAIPLSAMRRGDPTDTGPRRAYDAAISHLDAEIGTLLGSMLEHGYLNNTLIIVTADHGEEFNEHAALGHGQTLYTQALRVPLVLFWPGHLPPTRVSAPVSLARIPATVMELVRGQPGPFPGPSLVPLWRGDPAPHVAATSTLTFPPIRGTTEARKSITSVQVGQFHFIQYPGDSVGRLYDHASDPLEMRNLAWTQSADDVLRSLRDSLRVATSAVGTGRGTKP